MQQQGKNATFKFTIHFYPTNVANEEKLSTKHLDTTGKKHTQEFRETK
jgi:hypothetical protein